MAIALSPDELGYFRNALRRTQNTYQLGLAQNNYARQSAGNDYAINKGNLVTQFANLRNTIPGNFIHRGLINSGLYAQGLANEATQRDQALGNLTSQYNQQLGGFNLAQSQLGSVYNGGVDDINYQKRQRLATLLANGGY